MKRLHFILIIFICLFAPNVFALEVDVSNDITSPSSGGSGGGHYEGTEIYNTGGNFTYNVNTRYNGRLSRIRFNIPLPDSLGQCFSTNVDYKVTLNMATSDWRNKFGSVTASAYNTNFAHYPTVFVSKKKIYFTFKIPSSTTNCIDYVLVDLKSTNVSSTAFTGDTNWNLQSIKLNDPTSSSGGGGGGGTSPTPTPKPDYSDIINNQNENANNIINNQNENTNNVIENNNQNTETITNSIENGAKAITDVLGNKCSNLLDFPHTSSNPYSITATKDDYFVQTSFNVNLSSNITYYYSYKSNKDFSPDISHGVEFFLLKDGDYSTMIHPWGKSGTFTPTVSGNYVLRLDCNINGDTCTFYDFMISENTSSYCEYGSYSSKLDDTTNAINDTNSYLKDNSDPNIEDNEFTSLFDSVAINNPLDSLLQLPVQFINTIVNQSNSCQVVNLGTLLGVPISLPCIDIGSILGSTVWDTIDILSSIGLIVLILKQLYESITNALTLGGYMDAKKGGLGYMSPLEFLCDVLTGFGGDRV